MILIRGIKGEAYARKIEKGIVDCRDILSTLLEPPVTGYAYSDYYEKNLVKALSYFGNRNGNRTHLHHPDFLYSLFIDHFVPHIYLTYFHILNPKSLQWLDNFDDDYHFIAIDVALDKFTRTAIGTEYFGTQMVYVNSINDLQQDGFKNFQAACMCSLEHLFSNKKDMLVPLKIYNTLAFPLLCREQDEKFTDIENEFRIISYDCPKIINGILRQVPRTASLTGKSGVKYSGVLNAGNNTIFKSNSYALRNPNQNLKEILVNEHGHLTLDSQFKSIDIREISKKYGFIGDKKQCADFINMMLTINPPDTYVNRTVQKTYKIKEAANMYFTSSYETVDY